MTFLEIIKDVQDRLNLVSEESGVRIGRAVNRRYKEVTSSLGIDTTRRALVVTNVQVNHEQLTVHGIEKIISIAYRVVNPPRLLSLVRVEELRDQNRAHKTTPYRYALYSTDYNSVTIELDCIPTTNFPLYIEGYENISVLSGTAHPVFAESFHDILFWGALVDEYLKLEKPSLAKDAEARYLERISNLRMFIAKSGFMEDYQGKLVENARRMWWTENL